MRMIAPGTLIRMMAVVVTVLIFVSTSTITSAEGRQSPDAHIGGGSAHLSANSIVDCTQFTPVCSSQNPDSRRRGLGYWLLYGAWIAIRWLALLIWGFWEWALVVIGGIVAFSFVPRMARKVLSFSRTSRYRAARGRSIDTGGDGETPPEQTSREWLVWHDPSSATAPDTTDHNTDFDMTERHHHSCRCNDCIRHRNGRRRLAAERYNREGTPLPAGAMWYEVQGDHPIRYVDDTRPPVAQPPPEPTPWQWLEEQVTGRPDDNEPLQIDGVEHPQQETASRDDSGQVGSLVVPVQDRARREPAFRRQPEDAETDRELQREEMRGPLRQATSPPPADGDSGVTEAQDPLPVTPVPTTTRIRSGRGRFLLPFFVVLALIALAAGIGIVAYAFLSERASTSTQASVEPAPDIDATIAAAVAMIPAILAQTPAPPPDGTTLSNATSDGNRSVSTGTLVILPTAMPGELQAISCGNDCHSGMQLSEDYVEWLSEPYVSEDGMLSFSALVDEKANFVSASHHRCSLNNISLTDSSNALYGSIIPRSVEVQCGTRNGDWVADQYFYVGNQLTVRAQIATEAATHPALGLCLWTGGITKQQDRLLDCVPVRQP